MIKGIIKSLISNPEAPCLFVGLGNPGAEYINNRHNIGFMAIDAIASQLKAESFKAKFGGLYATAEVDGQKVLLLKPQTFMNRSGSSVSQVSSFYKIKPENVFVFHDELDIPLGKVKTKQGGGSAGHNGLKSIDGSIGKNYHRIRIGIDHPGDKNQVSDYVLSDFKKSEQLELEKVISAIAFNAAYLASAKPEDFNNHVARMLQPEKPEKKEKEKKEKNGI